MDVERSGVEWNDDGMMEVADDVEMWWRRRWRWIGCGMWMWRSKAEKRAWDGSVGRSFVRRSVCGCLLVLSGVAKSLRSLGAEFGTPRERDLRTEHSEQRPLIEID